jgi:hypothetical protein
VPNDRTEILLVAEDDELGPGDDEWVDDLEALRAGLIDGDVDVHEEHTARPGHKGTVTEIVVALGGSGAVTGLVAALRSWLEGRQTRRLRLTVRGRTPVEVDLRAEGLSDETLRKVVLDAIERSGRDG